MKKWLCLFVIISCIFCGCMPNPIEINVPQLPPKIAISSTTIGSDTLIVAASYSISSLANLNAGANGQNLPAQLDEILVKQALVTISDGTTTSTLSPTVPGIYWHTTMGLMSGKEYTLQVKDLAKDMVVTAKTIYFSALTPDLLLPVVTRTATDTLIQLKMNLTVNSSQKNYYLVAYDAINPATIPSTVGSHNFSIANVAELKKVEVFSDDDAVNGKINKTFTITGVKPTDSLFVHYGIIEKGYFDYLSSYKKSGSLINQITAEPITLPTNVITGLGYFAIYEAKRTFFDLKKY